MSWMSWIRLIFSWLALKKLKKRSLIVYLKALQVIRKSLRALFLLLIFSQIFLVGLIMTIYSAIQLLPADPEMKLYVLLSIGGAFMLVSIVAVLMMTSDRLWYRLSGVEDQLNR